MNRNTIPILTALLLTPLAVTAAADRARMKQLLVVTPAGLDGKRVWLEFEGVYRAPRVWLNGVLVAEKLNGYGGFHGDITRHLKPAGRTNVDAVRADNRLPDTAQKISSAIVFHAASTGRVAAEPSLVPDTPSTAPDYFCTWNVQGFACSYSGASNQADMLVEASLFGTGTNQNWLGFYPDSLPIDSDTSWNERRKKIPRTTASLTARTRFPGNVIHRVGLMAARPGDISNPGLVLAVERLTTFVPKPAMRPGRNAEETDD